MAKEVKCEICGGNLNADEISRLPEDDDWPMCDRCVWIDMQIEAEQLGPAESGEALEKIRDWQFHMTYDE